MSIRNTDVVEDIALVFSPVRTANRRSDMDMLRERTAERDSFRRTFAGSKADLIEASFDALMGEC